MVEKLKEILESKLSDRAKIAYLLLHTKFNEDKEGAYNFLRRVTKYGDFAVKTILKDLESNGFIKRVKIRKKSTKELAGNKLILMYSPESKYSLERQLKKLSEGEYEILD